MDTSPPRIPGCLQVFLSPSKETSVLTRAEELEDVALPLLVYNPAVPRLAQIRLHTCPGPNPKVTEAYTANSGDSHFPRSSLTSLAAHP